MSDAATAIDLGRKTHRCPWLHTARHIEQFDYYHPTKGILVKPCCSLRPNRPDDFELTSNRAEHNIQRMIKEFEQGMWPKECQVCEKEEFEGMISERLRAFDTPLHSIDAANTRRHLHVKFSNLCNLACRVCNSTESTLYGRKIEDRDPALFTQVDISEHTDWPQLLDYLEKEIHSIPNVRLCLVGGETTLAPGVDTLANWLIDNDYLRRIHIAFASNMINMPDSILDIGRQCASMTISASLDSTHENFHYVRWPGTWRRATDTVDKILKYRQEHQCKIILQICPNFNINNIFYFDDFLDYWSEHEHDMMLVFNLYAPSVFRIDTIPNYIRPHLIERLQRCLDHRFFAHSGYSEPVRFWLSTTIDRLLDFSNVNLEMWHRYLLVNAEFDQVTNTSIWTYNARLADLFSDSDRQFYQQVLARPRSNRLTRNPGILFDDNDSKWREIASAMTEWRIDCS